MFPYLYDLLIEANISQLQRKQKSIVYLFPSFYDRVDKIKQKGGIRLANMNENHWFFRVHSGTKSGVWYDVVINFVNIKDILNKLVKDRRLWREDRSSIDYRKLGKLFLDDVDIKISCSCPAQQFWGGNYILTKYMAKHTRPENRPPKIRNPKEYGCFCKHIQAVFMVLPFYASTAASWLKNFYSSDVKRIEEEAIKQQEELRKAVKFLEK